MEEMERLVDAILHRGRRLPEGNYPNAVAITESGSAPWAVVTSRHTAWAA